MRNRKSIKRLGWVYAVFMATGIAMCVWLIRLSNAVGGVNSEQVRLAEETKQEKEMAAMTEESVMGDIYDKNGKLIVSEESDGKLWYRHDEAYSNVIGFTGLSNTRSGHLLMGKFATDLFYADGGTNRGRNLTLTLDADVQEFAYDLINSGGGDLGSIVVLNAKTGAVIAMAYNPSFSIQEIQNGTLTLDAVSESSTMFSPLQNPTRPGSIFKIVTSIGITEQNLENMVIDDEGSGTWKQDGVEISNFGGYAYGALTYKTALIKSSNIYFGRMAYEQIKWDQFEEFVCDRCKVGETLGLDFGTVLSQYDYLADEDEAGPNTAEGRYDTNQELAKAAYGYADIKLTSLQAAMITQGIANDGIMCTPYMVESICKTEGYEISDGIYRYTLGEVVESINNNTYGKGETTKITSPEASDKITDAMQGVYESVKSNSSLEGVEEGGIVIDGVKYSVALKTGTADISTDMPQYNNTWMVSFSPAEDPQYVVVVNRYGVTGKVGANLFDDVVKMYQVLF